MKKTSSQASTQGKSKGISKGEISRKIVKAAKPVKQAVQALRAKTTAVVKAAKPVMTQALVRKTPIQMKAKKSSGGARELTKEQTRLLEGKLRELARDLKASITDKTLAFDTSSHTESIIKGDDAEVAEKQRQANTVLQEIDFFKTRLALVLRALRKIEEGGYGYCEESEEPIGFERLTVVPWTRYAVHVQELREMKLRDYRGNKLRAEA